MRVRIVAGEPLSRKERAAPAAERTALEGFGSEKETVDALEMPALDEPALDPVPKPCSHGRAQEASKVTPRRADNERPGQFEKIASQLDALLSKSTRIAIKTKGKILLIEPTDVASVEAQGNYVLLQRNSSSHILRESMSKMAERLLPYGFIRIHRSVLVNTSFVEEIQPWGTGEYVLRIKGGKEFTVSRTYRNNLRSIARSWIGA